MKTITKSVIKLSELPKQLQNDKIFDGHKMHSYEEAELECFKKLIEIVKNK